MRRITALLIVFVLVFSLAPATHFTFALDSTGITIDGNLNDWPTTLLLNDPIGDGKWGTNNDIRTVGVYSDGNYIYIAGIFKKSGWNNLGVILDLIERKGAKDTKGHPWGRSYSVASGDIDIMIETWESDLRGWLISPDNTFIDVTSHIKRAYGTTDDWIVVEIAVPLSIFGDIKNPSLKVAFVLTGGSDGALQWFSDIAPDQDVPTWNEGGGAVAPAIITRFIFWSPDQPLELQIVDSNFSYEKYLLERKATHIASFITMNSFYGQRKFNESYSRYESIKDELKKYQIAPEVEARIEEYDSEVANLLELYHNGLSTINIPGLAFVGAFRIYRAYIGMRRITLEMEEILENAKERQYEKEKHLEELSKKLTKTIDGNLDDWSVQPIAVDTEGYGQDGANLKALYVDYDDNFLYIALTTDNKASWRVAYGIALDYKDGGYTTGQDSWGKKVSFTRGIDAELYFFWNGEFFGNPGTGTITSAQLTLWNGNGWDYKDLQWAGFYAYTGGNETGLQTLEIAIPWEELGGKPKEIHIVAYVTGQGAGDSAVDSLPLQEAVMDKQPGDEWGDEDTFTEFASVSII